MNYIPQLAKMLGVEIGERFDIVDGNALYFSNCYFSDNGFVFGDISKSGVGYSNYDVLARVLQGAWQIKKLPWEPVSGEIVYVPIIRDGETMAKKCYYEDTEKGEQLLKAGFICKNKQEAEEKAKAMLRAVKEYDAAREV